MQRKRRFFLSGVWIVAGYFSDRLFFAFFPVHIRYALLGESGKMGIFCPFLRFVLLLVSVHTVAGIALSSGSFWVMGPFAQCVFYFPLFSVFNDSKKFFFSLSRKKSGGSFRTREKHPPPRFLFLSLFGKTEKNTAARKSWNLFRSLRRCKGTYTADKSAPRG